MDDIYPVDWNSPESLRAGADFYRQRAAAMPDPRFERFRPVEVQHDPYAKPDGMTRLVTQPIAEPPVEDEETRTARARYLIMKSLEEERRQDEAQRQQAQNDQRAALRETALWKLLARSP
jgi:hypothetical protein